MVFFYDFWFIFVVVLFVGFFFLEGFDFGVGMVICFFGYNELECRVLINMIGLFWDVNEVWFLIGVGVIFVVFLNWYVMMLSGYYILFVIVLFVLMGCGVVFEFCGKVDYVKWVKVWDWVVFFGSLIFLFVFGVLFMILFCGMLIDVDMNIYVYLFDYINVYFVFGGVIVIFFCFQYGLMFIMLCMIGDL